MFDWFWNFLYGISKGIMRIIDMIMHVINMLAGIEPINIDGEETDFLTYLLTSSTVKFAFAIAAILSLILLVYFTIFAIIKTLATEKGEDTPTGICKKAFKNIIILLLIPGFMIAFILVGNQFMLAMYKATLGGSENGICNFMFQAFAVDARNSGVSEADLLKVDWTSTSAVRSVIDLTDFAFIYSWIAGFCIMFTLGKSVISFVERAISITLLYIVAPFTVASAVIDDGQRFKMWRDQIMVKFITGYGMILAINVYILVMALVCRDSVHFFDNSTLNAFMKLFIILGGAISLQSVQGIVGNLVQQGAGDKAMQDQRMANMTAGYVASKAGGAALAVAKSPFTVGRGISNFVGDKNQYGWGTAIGSRLGFKTRKDYGGMSQIQAQKQQEIEANRNQALIQGIGNLGDTVSNKINQALQGRNNNNQDDNNNQNNNNANQPGRGQNMVNNAIQGNNLGNNNQ